MNKGDLFVLFKQQYGFFIDNYRQSQKIGEDIYIHQFRVAVKRLNAFKDFFKSISDTQGQALMDQLFENVKAVYKPAGKVRNLQVFIPLIEGLNNQPCSKFLVHINELIRQKLQLFFIAGNDVSFDSEYEYSLALQRILDDYYNCSVFGFRDYLYDNRVKASQLVFAHEAGEEWHEARTIYKRNSILLQMYMQTYNSEQFLTDSVYYRELEQLLGRWHDLIMLSKLNAKFELKENHQTQKWSNYKTEIADNLSLLQKEIRHLVLSAKNY
jgi:CHAD domain-containing protein